MSGQLSLFTAIWSQPQSQAALRSVPGCLAAARPTDGRQTEFHREHVCAGGRVSRWSQFLISDQDCHNRVWSAVMEQRTVIMQTNALTMMSRTHTRTDTRTHSHTHTRARTQLEAMFFSADWFRVNFILLKYSSQWYLHFLKKMCCKMCCHDGKVLWMVALLCAYYWQLILSVCILLINSCLTVEITVHWSENRVPW